MKVTSSFFVCLSFCDCLTINNAHHLFIITPTLHTGTYVCKVKPVNTHLFIMFIIKVTRGAVNSFWIVYPQGR